MSKNTIKLIWGYLPTVDDRSFAAAFLPIAAQAGLTQRVAVVFDTYRPDKGPDMYFDWALLLALLRQALSLLQWESISIDQDEKRFNSLEELTRFYETWAGPDLDPNPPRTIRVMAGNQAVGLMITEDYTGSGGPAPYHDSLTFSFYLKHLDPSQFRESCRIACVEQGATISEEITGVPVLRISMWRKLVNMLRRMF